MTEIDDELAEATDALLSGREMNLSSENRELGGVVRELYRVIDPKTLPSAAFQQRMTVRLSSEWERSFAPPALRLIDRPYARLVALAAAVVLVLGAIIVLAVPDNSQQLQGTAIGMDRGAAILVLIGVALVGAIFYWRSRR